MISDFLFSAFNGSTVPQILQPCTSSVGRPVPSAVESFDRKTTASK